MALSYARFATEAAHLASQCAHWSAKTSIYYETGRRTHMEPRDVEHFVSVLRATADMIEELNEKEVTINGR